MKEGSMAVTQEVMCVFFRASDGKRDGDISRNLALIDRAIEGAVAPALAEGKPQGNFMTHPHDSSLYVLPLPPGTDEETVQLISRRLDNLEDRDREKLLDAWPNKMASSALRPAGYSAPAPRAAANRLE